LRRADFDRLLTTPALSNADLADCLELIADWYARRCRESNPATLVGDYAPPVIMEAARRLRAERMEPVWLKPPSATSLNPYGA
jgi:hypothetical protein